LIGCEPTVSPVPDSLTALLATYGLLKKPNLGRRAAEGPEVLSIGGGMTVGRNPTASEQAWEEIFAFLGEN